MKISEKNQLTYLQNENERLRQELEKLKKNNVSAFEQKFAAAFRSNPDALVISSQKDGIIQDVNDVFLSLFGVTREEIMGRSSVDLNMFANPEDRIALISHLRQHGQVRNYETRIRRRSGEECTVLISAESICIDGQDILLTIIQDISDRKKIEDDLRKSRESYKQLLESANSIIIRYLPEGTIIYANGYALRFFGYEKEEMVGQPIRMILPDSNENNSHNLVDEIMANPQNFEQFENANLRKNAETVWISWTNRVIRDERGNVTEILAIGNDISSRKKAENSLKAEHNILDAVVNNIGVGFVVSDHVGNITSMNQAAAVIHDFNSPDEGLYHLRHYTNEFVLASPDGRLLTVDQWPLSMALRGEYINNYKLILYRRKSNTSRVISYNTVPVHHVDGSLMHIVLTLTDLTSIDRGTKTLAYERELFEGIFNNIPVMITIYDPELKNFRFNKEYKNILGWNEEDAADGNMMGKVYPDPEYRQKVTEYMQSLQSGWKEWQVTTKAGILVDSIWANILLTSGVQIGIGIDIRKQKESEGKLRENEQRLQGIFDNAGIGIVETDHEDRWVRVNNRLCQILGFTREELTGKTVHEITHPEDRSTSDDLNNKLHLGELNLISYEKRYLKKDGKPLWVHVSISSIVDEQGKYLKSIGTVEDISERKQAVENLRQSEEKFRSLFENITEGVALYEVIYNDGHAVDFRVLEVNPAYKKYTGIENGNSSERRDSMPDLKTCYEVAETGNPYRFESFFPEMNRHFVINVISPRKGQFATVFEDITDQKRIENEVKQKNEELTRFIYTVSHDLKSPLVTIKSFTEYLREDIDAEDKPAQEKDIGYIQNAADKMGRLLDELLELSRIGRKEDFKTETPLEEIVNAAVDLVAGSISKRNAEVKITGFRVMLYGHAQRLIQLYQNLIDNAVKFMGDQPHPLIEAGAMEGKTKGETILFVRDNGTGIDPRYQHKVFGLFEKLDTGTEGTGIGLALVKRIIEVHGGNIWFHSEGKNKGTTFFFTLERTRKIKNGGKK